MFAQEEYNITVSKARGIIVTFPGGAEPGGGAAGAAGTKT